MLGSSFLWLRWYKVAQAVCSGLVLRRHEPNGRRNKVGWGIEAVFFLSFFFSLSIFESGGVVWCDELQ